MPFDPDYIDKLYNALKSNVDGFTKSSTDFRSAITSDTAYANKVYLALKNNVDGFVLPQPEFNKRLGFDSQEVKQQSKQPTVPTFMDVAGQTQQTIQTAKQNVPNPVYEKPKPTTGEKVGDIMGKYGITPPMTEQQSVVQYGGKIGESLIKQRDEAIENTIKYRNDKLGIKTDTSSVKYKNDVKKLRDQFNEGEFVKAEGKNGKQYVVPGAGFWGSAGMALAESFKAPVQAWKINTLEGKDLADYLDRLQRDEPFLPEKKPSGVAGAFGETAGGFPKFAAIMSAGNAIAPMMGTGLVGAEAEFVSTAMYTRDLYQRNLQKLLDEGVPVEEARLQAADKAKKDAPVIAMPDAAMAVGLGVNLNPTRQVAAETFKKLLVKEAAHATKIGLAGGGAELAKAGTEVAMGYDVTPNEALERFADATFEWATMDAMFKVLPLMRKMPGALKASYKEYLRTIPREVIEQQAAEKNVPIEEIDAELNSYEAARSKVADIVPEESVSTFAGLTEKQDKLKSEISELESKKAATPEGLHPQIEKEIEVRKSEIESINKQIADIAEKGNAEKIDIDRRTGEPEIKKPEEISQPIELEVETPQAEKVIPVNEQQLTTSTSQTNSDNLKQFNIRGREIGIDKPIRQDFQEGEKGDNEYAEANIKHNKRVDDLILSIKEEGVLIDNQGNEYDVEITSQGVRVILKTNNDYKIYTKGKRVSAETPFTHGFTFKPKNQKTQPTPQVETAIPVTEQQPTVTTNVAEGFREAGEKSRDTKDATHIGRWMLDNSQKGDVIRFQDGGYEVTEINTKKDGTKELVLTPFEFNEDGTKDYNNSGIKIITEQSIKNGSNLFENAYTNSKGERVIEQSTYERTAPTSTDKVAEQQPTPQVETAQIIEPTSSQKSQIEYKRLVEPQKPISEMNSEELYELAIANRKELKKQDFEFKDKTEKEKEESGYYNVIDDVEDLRDTSERINFIENAENVNDLASSTESALRKFNKDNPSEYSLAILNAIRKKAIELNIKTEDLIKAVVKKIGNKYQDVDDAETMIRSYLEKIAISSQTDKIQNQLSQQPTPQVETAIPVSEQKEITPQPQVVAEETITPNEQEEVVNYEDAIKITPTSELSNPELYGTDELGMEAKTAALRDEEKTPPIFKEYKTGTYAKDRFGDLYQLQEVPIENIILPEGEQKRESTISKYKKWYKKGSKFPPAKGVENYAVYNGKVVVNDGHHRVVAAKQLGLKTIPVWVSLTDPKNPARPITDINYHKSLQQEITVSKEKTNDEQKIKKEELGANQSFENRYKYEIDGGTLEIGKVKNADRFSVLSLHVDESKRRKGIATKLLKQAIRDTEGKISGQASNDASVDMNYKLGMRAYENGQELTLEETKKLRAKQTSVNMKYSNPDFEKEIYNLFERKTNELNKIRQENSSYNRATKKYRAEVEKYADTINSLNAKEISEKLIKSILPEEVKKALIEKKYQKALDLTKSDEERARELYENEYEKIKAKYPKINVPKSILNISPITASLPTEQQTTVSEKPIVAEKIVDTESNKPIESGVIQAKPETMTNYTESSLQSFANKLRGKNVTKVEFKRPIVGKNGVKLLAYNWEHEELIPAVTSKEGATKKAVRVSDWAKAGVNVDTGRNIVHKFIVETADGKKMEVSADSLAKVLGYTNKEMSDAFPQLKDLVKKIAKLKLEEQSLLFDLGYAQSVKAEIIKKLEKEYGIKIPVYKAGDKYNLNEAAVGNPITEELSEESDINFKFNAELRKRGLWSTDISEDARRLLTVRKQLQNKENQINQLLPISESEPTPITETPKVESKEATTQQPDITVTEPTTTQPIVEEVKSDLGTKARDLAAKVRSGEKQVLPDWLQASLPKGTKKQGIDINEAFAKALETFADIYDTTKDFAQAVEQGFKNIKDWFDENKVPYNEAELKEKFAQDRQGEIPTESQPPPPSEPPVSEQGEGKGFRHADTEKIRERSGLEPYQKIPETIQGWIDEARQRIKDGYNVEALLNRVEKGVMPDAVEQNIIGEYLMYLDEQVKANPSDENIAKLKRVVEISDKVGGSEIAKSLVARRGSRLPDDSLGNFFIQQMEATGANVLTENQKQVNTKEFEEIQAANNEYKEKVKILEEEVAKLKAQKEIDEVRKKSQPSKTKKTHEDYVKERQDIIKQMREDLLKVAKGSGGLQSSIPGAAQLKAIAPHVGKLVKSLVDENYTKLEEVVKLVYNEVKDIVEGITEKDIQNIIAGDYSEKKQTRSNLAETLRDLKTEAKLLGELEKLQNGVEPKVERQKQIRNKRITDLQNQIKELRKQQYVREKEFDKFYTEDLYAEFKKLAALRKRTESEIAEVEEKIKKGDFAPEERKPLLLNPELKKKYPEEFKKAVEAKDKLIKLKQEREIRLLKEKYANRTKYQKIQDAVVEVSNVPRAIMASVDFSAPLRQGIITTVAYPTISMKAAVEMFKQAFSQKAFDRWFYDVKEHPRYELAKKSTLHLADPHDPKLSAKEEQFMSNLAEKIPVIGRLVKGSERAYIAFLNKVRWDVFNRMADAYESEGKTFENSEKLYRETGDYINTVTGRGTLGKFEESAQVLNAAFFSPRLIASRVKLLTNFANPNFYYNVPKEVRVQYFKDMAKFLGAGLSVLTLAKLYQEAFGSDEEDEKVTVEVDPRSSDFGKIKVGNTRYDIWGGFQPYVRLMAQMFTGQRKTTTTGEIQNLQPKQKFQTASNFFRGKLAPVPASGVDIITGETVTGDRVQPLEELTSMLIPLTFQDLSEAIKDKGVSAIFTTGIPSTFGIGTQTYTNTSTLEGLYDRNLTSKQTMDINKITKYENGFKKPITKDEFKKFTQKRDSLIQEGLDQLYKNGQVYVKNREVIKKSFEEMTPIEVQDEIKKIKTSATKKAKEELFPIPDKIKDKLNRDLEKQELLRERMQRQQKNN